MTVDASATAEGTLSLGTGLQDTTDIEITAPSSGYYAPTIWTAGSDVADGAKMAVNIDVFVYYENS